MNCEEIKNLLSEYLDRELNQGACELVEEHLDNCPVCREELQVLKECLKSLGSLKKVEPPSDFLSQVHARLEGQASFKAAFKKIIFPLHIKIPLEAAGLAAAAVLLFYILNLSPEKQSIQSVPLTASMRTREEIEKSLKITGAMKPLFYPEETMETARDHSPDRLLAAGRAMEPAAPPAEGLLEPEPAAPFLGVMAEAGGGRAETVELVLLIESEMESADEETRSDGIFLPMKAKGIRRSEAPTAGGESEKTLPAPPLTRLKDLIAREGGEIISTEDGGDHTRRIAIRLPVDHYHPFIEKLSEISDIPADQSIQPTEDSNTIRLRLCVK